ncbi:MAG: hypothetical protein H6695_19105 [Deferribacteres bacterium]|nr:hypothetical protein [candidate division KSB1 bacterium]MCB9512296.1 hypothetical protein [Deferribacteres bacterium]
MTRDVQWVVGIDGGGTKSVLSLIDSSGRVLARTRCAATNYQPQNIEKIVAELTHALQQLFQQAGFPATEKPDILCACLSGLGRDDARSHVRQALTDAQLARQIITESDALAALYGAFSGQPGIIVIAGTGSIAFGKSPSGEVFRCGGWGYLLGDEGSGFAIGRNAITAALQAWDGRGPTTALKQKMETFFEVDSIEQAITVIYQNYATRGALAQCAPLVFEAAQQGDQVALRIVTDAAGELARLVVILWQQFAESGAGHVALLGNLFQNDLLHAHVASMLQQRTPTVTIVEPDFPADIGAALLGMEKCQINLSETVRTALKENLRDHLISI